MTGGSLVLLLGAGFSAPFDVPPMKPLYNGFVKFAKKKYPQLSETLEAVLQKCTKDADVEELIAELNQAASADQGLPSDMAEDERLRKWQIDAEYLRWHLASYIIELCENFDRSKAVDCCGQFFRKLANDDRLPTIDIFTTNYDRVVEHVFETQELSFVDGFQQQEGVLVNPWTAEFDSDIRLLKLHGSVTWYRYSDGGDTRALRLDRGYPLPDPTFRLSAAGKSLEPLMVLPTSEKETSEEPYGHLFQRFANILTNARVVVVIGNSLRDSHLLSALRYNQDHLLFLVIDHNPKFAIDHLKADRAVGLSADIGDLLLTHSSQLVDTLESVLKDSNLDNAQSTLSTFANSYRQTITATAELDPIQQNSLIALDSSDEFKVLDALQHLRGVNNQAVLDRTFGKLDSTSNLIKIAAAGNLGIVGATTSAEKLSHLAENDRDASVRLEAKLALKELK